VAVLGVSTAVLVGVIVTIAVVALVLIVVAPWRSVRRERPLDTDIETRLLLGEDPARVAADADASDAATARVVDLDANRSDDEA
jgi:hypothetical protein